MVVFGEAGAFLGERGGGEGRGGESGGRGGRLDFDWHWAGGY